MKIIPVLNEDQVVSLRASDAISYLESDFALSCRLALYLVQWTFHNCKEKEKYYRTNPMNLLGARLLQKSLEKSAIDTFSEIDELITKIGLERGDIVGMKELKNHRHFHSHTYLGEFKDKNVKKFVEEGLQHKDDMGLRVWQVRATVLQLMIKNKIPTDNILRLNASEAMIMTVVDILNSASHNSDAANFDMMRTMFQMFSAALMGVYAKSFQDEFVKLYSEGPLIA